MTVSTIITSINVLNGQFNKSDVEIWPQRGEMRLQDPIAEVLSVEG
jgi:hypothetical protein